MRLLILGHSMIHIRQQLFAEYLASLGHEVLAITPGQWGEQRATSMHRGTFTLQTCRHMGGDNQWGFTFFGLEPMVEQFKPDWVYLQQEPGSALASQVLKLKEKLGFRMACFSWENYTPFRPVAGDFLKACDLVVCGNGECQKLVEPHNKNTIVALQVGVNTDHFAARPDVKRVYSVGYIGRPVKEKGIEQLQVAYPNFFILPWTAWQRLPWMLSMMKVVVVYSQDMDVVDKGTIYHWREQAPPYVSIEAMATGCAVVTSNSGSIPYWMGGVYCEPCLGAVIVDQHSITSLKLAIEETLGKSEDMGAAGREWVVNHLSYKPQAERLLTAMEGH